MKNSAKISILVTMVIAFVSNVNANIVVAHDVNTLASVVGGPNEQQFAINVASWLIGSNSGSILAIESNPVDVKRDYALDVKTALAGAGYNVTYESNATTITNLTLQDLAPFDAIFSGMTWPSQAVIDPMVLVDYIKTGGHVYVYSGAGDLGFHAVEASKHNPFLEQFGLAFDASRYTQRDAFMRAPEAARSTTVTYASFRTHPPTARAVICAPTWTT